jgi:long-chain acyl-CoA synthetase
MAGYYFVLMVGGRISYAENLETVPTNLLEVHPTILTGVPRFYEKMYERIQEAVRTAPALRRTIFHWAMRVARHQGDKRWAIQYWLADHLVFSKLRARLGGRLRFCVSGSAPLSKHLAEFFYSAGILILEGYGLTETSPVISVNRPDRFKFGTVGPPLPGVEVKIAPDGEILTRGPHVMKGYFNNPAATAEAIDPEGWFHTGDVGTFDEEGFLAITDRKKDLIKTSGGKMVAPQNLENALKKEPLVADCVVIGDRRKYVTALIVPNFEKLEAFARKNSIPFVNREDLVRQPQIVDLVWQPVQALNQTLAPFEQLKKITLLPEPFTAAAGELSPTLKVKRKAVTERYASQIEAMYQETPAGQQG